MESERVKNNSIQTLGPEHLFKKMQNEVGLILETFESQFQEFDLDKFEKGEMDTGMDIVDPLSGQTQVLLPRPKKSVLQKFRDEVNANPAKKTNHKNNFLNKIIETSLTYNRKEAHFNKDGFDVSSRAVLIKKTLTVWGKNARKVALFVYKYIAF